MGHFCPSGSGFGIRIRIHWPNRIRIHPDPDPKHWLSVYRCRFQEEEYEDRHKLAQLLPPFKLKWFHFLNHIHTRTFGKRSLLYFSRLFYLCTQGFFCRFSVVHCPSTLCIVVWCSLLKNIAQVSKCQSSLSFFVVCLWLSSMSVGADIICWSLLSVVRRSSVRAWRSPDGTVVRRLAVRQARVRFSYCLIYCFIL